MQYNRMQYNRLRWASRRGMLELDLILGPFLENVYHKLNADDQTLYATLLESEDQDLFGWFLQHKTPPTPELQKIVSIILDNTGMKMD